MYKKFTYIIKSNYYFEPLSWILWTGLPPSTCYQLNVKTFHSIMNIVHYRSNTPTLYPNQNSSLTIIWSEMDTWNPPVCALHNPNIFNCQHIKTDQYRPPQCKVIWFTKCIYQTPFMYFSCWKITHSLNLSLSLSLVQTAA